MKLYGSLTSPYVRKARVLIAEKKLPVEMVIEDPWPEDSRIPTRNPLGKVPVLEVEPGNTLFESVLVLHYLDHVDGKSITPKDAAGYWQSQWWQSLGNGMIDAAVAHVLETRRPAGKQMPEKLAREEARIERAVTVAESRFRASAVPAGTSTPRASSIPARRTMRPSSSAIAPSVTLCTVALPRLTKRQTSSARAPPVANATASAATRSVRATSRNCRTADTSAPKE